MNYRMKLQHRSRLAIRAWPPTAIYFAITAAIALLWLAPALADERKPQPVPLTSAGVCPSGYSPSGGYCTPHLNTRARAIPKAGYTPCPSGYSESMGYCVEIGK
jgi:hypothetical protein